MNCANCGTETRPGQKFCLSCGAGMGAVCPVVLLQQLDQLAGAGRATFTRPAGAAGAQSVGAASRPG